MFPNMICLGGIEGVFAVEYASYPSRGMLSFLWTICNELLCKPHETTCISNHAAQESEITQTQ